MGPFQLWSRHMVKKNKLRYGARNVVGHHQQRAM